MKKYGPLASKEVEKAVHEYKHDHKYSSRKQAVAVGLSEAKRKGGRIPSITGKKEW